MYLQLRLLVCGGSFPVTMANALTFGGNVMAMMNVVITQMKEVVEVMYHIILMGGVRCYTLGYNRI